MTTLLVQTERILYNLQLMQKKVGKAEVLPVLSGNAFGLGDAAVAQVLATRAGVKFFAVSRLEEAERIAASVKAVDILILTPYSTEEEITRILQGGFLATVDSPECAVLLSGVAKRLGVTARVHLKFDCGFGRFGFLCEDAAKAAQSIRFLDNLSVCGVYSHMGKCKKEKQAKTQCKRFMDAVQTLRREGVDCGLVHLASTYNALCYPFLRLNMVRMGEGLSGRLSGRDRWGFKRVGRLVSEVCDVRWIPAGHPIGEEGKKRRRATKVAVAPVGSADGLLMERDRRPGLFSKPKWGCEITGEDLPVIGKPGYTSTLIDVTGTDCAAGDAVSFDISPRFVSPFLRRDYV